MTLASWTRDGVLHLRITTPGASVNIFDRRTAVQVHDALTGIDPAKVRAVVVESGCPGSFVNGVGLLLAQAASGVETVVEASRPAREAFQALQSCPVPTIAAVEGTCWGCGVEMVLHCKYRVAADTRDTHFYMTELNDYLFLPLFGSTWNLPHLVGVKAAIDLLLWGERWTAQRALQGGLVDAVLPHERFDDEVSRFVDRVTKGAVDTQPLRPSWSPGDAQVVADAEARIATLPPDYQPVYRNGLDLIVRAAKRTTERAKQQMLEIARSADSATAQLGKDAFAFFHIRQMSTSLSTRGQKPPMPAEVMSVGSSPSSLRFEAFRQDLLGRTLRDVHFVPEVEAVGPGAIQLVPATATPTASTRDAVTVSLTLGLPPKPDHVVIHNPVRGGRLFEIRAPDRLRERARTVAHYLRRADFEIVTGGVGPMMATDELIAAYLRPLASWLLDGGSAAVMNATLRSLGFVRRPHALVAQLDRPGLVALLTRHIPLPSYAERAIDLFGFDGHEAPVEPRLIDALGLSLLAAARRCAEKTCLGHASKVDVVAREVLDFPLRLTSLCAWLDLETVGGMVGRAAAPDRLATAEDLRSASEYLAGEEPFYR